MVRTIDVIEVYQARLNGDPAHARNGIAGIDAQIGKDLIDLGRIHLYRTCPRLRQPDKFDVLTD
ncbi:MAG: hypothetical protein ACD_75C02199G0001 [uncultured bacterium]|nr:MAG: hypothetical protein ACD_75C02199G0001 [uncultured bacterium]